MRLNQCTLQSNIALNAPAHDRNIRPKSLIYSVL